MTKKHMRFPHSMSKCLWDVLYVKYHLNRQATSTTDTGTLLNQNHLVFTYIFTSLKMTQLILNDWTLEEYFEHDTLTSFIFQLLSRLTVKAQHLQWRQTETELDCCEDPLRVHFPPSWSPLHSHFISSRALWENILSLSNLIPLDWSCMQSCLWLGKQNWVQLLLTEHHSNVL